MAYPPTDFPDFVNSLLDGVEKKLRTDTRVPSELRNNVRRSPPIADNRAYPILYVEDGEAVPEKFTTSGRQNYTIRLRLTVLVKSQDPLQGSRLSKDYVLKLVQTLLGTPEDKRLLDSGGNSLAQNVQASARWGQAAKDQRGELVWVGVVNVAITADFRS